MKLFRKIPFLLSWSVFCILTSIPAWGLALWALPYLRELFLSGIAPQLTPNISFVLFVATCVIISFFAFVFSISKIAFPLYQAGKVPNHEPAGIKFRSYLPKWFLYLVYYVVYCVPLAFKGLMPPEIETPVYMAWGFLASFLAYRGVVHSWLDDVLLHGQQSSEDQIMVA